MQGCEDDVEAAKLLVVEIECAVVHDVHLDSVKNLDPPHARSDAGDFGGLLWNIGGRQGPGRPGALRMVGDCDLLIAELFSGADHIGNLVLAVAPGTCVWRSPRMSSSEISAGSVLFPAASISPSPARSSGAM